MRCGSQFVDIGFVIEAEPLFEVEPAAGRGAIQKIS
jgi:hypothetical protein